MWLYEQKDKNFPLLAWGESPDKDLYINKQCMHKWCLLNYTFWYQCIRPNMSLYKFCWPNPTNMIKYKTTRWEQLLTCTITWKVAMCLMDKQPLFINIFYLFLMIIFFIIEIESFAYVPLRTLILYISIHVSFWCFA